jgi:hypothetical protein
MCTAADPVAVTLGYQLAKLQEVMPEGINMEAATGSAMRQVAKAQKAPRAAAGGLRGGEGGG